jgi:hypothetical protein
MEGQEQAEGIRILCRQKRGERDKRGGGFLGRRAQ